MFFLPGEKEEVFLPHPAGAVKCPAGLVKAK
jgi:hypothetical protein